MDQLPRLGKREPVCLLLFTCNCVVYVGVPLPLGAWDGLRYFIVTLSEPSINNFLYFNPYVLNGLSHHYLNIFGASRVIFYFSFFNEIHVSKQ